MKSSSIFALLAIFFGTRSGLCRKHFKNEELLFAISESTSSFSFEKELFFRDKLTKVKILIDPCNPVALPDTCEKLFPASIAIIDERNDCTLIRDSGNYEVSTSVIGRTNQRKVTVFAKKVLLDEEGFNFDLIFEYICDYSQQNSFKFIIDPPNERAIATFAGPSFCPTTPYYRRSKSRQAFFYGIILFLVSLPLMICHHTVCSSYQTFSIPIHIMVASLMTKIVIIENFSNFEFKKVLDALLLTGILVFIAFCLHKRRSLLTLMSYSSFLLSASILTEFGRKNHNTWSSKSIILSNVAVGAAYLFMYLRVPDLLMLISGSMIGSAILSASIFQIGALDLDIFVFLEVFSYQSDYAFTNEQKWMLGGFLVLGFAAFLFQSARYKIKAKRRSVTSIPLLSSEF